MDPTFRLRTATRLHFLLLRRYGQDIDVNLLLKSQATKHDGLWLCRATGDKELIALARRLARANHAHALDEARLREAAARMARPAAGATARELPWGPRHLGLRADESAGVERAAFRGGSPRGPLAQSKALAQWLRAADRPDRKRPVQVAARRSNSPPSLTWSPTAYSSSSTVPSRGEAMVCSIFMASITASGWPSVTTWPTWARKAITLPGIGAVCGRPRLRPRRHGRSGRSRRPPPSPRARRC